MTAPVYALLGETNGRFPSNVQFSTRNPFGNNNTTRHQPRAQTFPAARGASYQTSQPLRPRKAASQAQRRSSDQYKSKAASERRRSSAQSWRQKIRGFVNPSLHDLEDANLIAPDTGRPYIHTRQRWRLWRLTIGEFLMTVILSLAYFLLLYSWSQYLTINERQKQTFNALSTGLSLLLGLNLAGSLRSYAKLLRWRILAAAYRPLETFDLVLGCDSQINVLRLLWKARNSRYRYLPSRTQICCVAWLTVNLVMAGIVASIGLTYNLDTSERWVLESAGEVSVIDFSNLVSSNYLLDLSYLQSWGVTGTSVRKMKYFDYAHAAQGHYQSDSKGNSRYWFIDVNGRDRTSTDVSFRYVDASVNCTSYSVTEGIYGNQSYIIYTDGTHEVNQTLLAPPGPAGLGLVTNTNSTCGNRCTDVLVFQAIPLPNDTFTTISKPTLFACQSGLDEVLDDSGVRVDSYSRISDQLARMLSGAIGWSGVPLPTTDSHLQYMSYPESSPVGFTDDSNDLDMAGLIADFTIGTLAALDDPNLDGPRVLREGTAPLPAEYLHVKWWKFGGLLITIPCVHFVTLFIVIHWANRAVIKDDSHLAAAKLYYSLLTRGYLADHGCMLKGEEIVEAMGNPMVAYGWSEKEGIKHTDVFFEDSGMDTGSRFKEGRYDGNGWGPYRDIQPAHHSRRTVDARRYF